MVYVCRYCVPCVSFSHWMCCVAKSNYTSGIWHCRRALDLCVDANTLCSLKYRQASICLACLHVPQHLACQLFDGWIREIGPNGDWCHCRWRSNGKSLSFVLCLHFRHYSPPSILHLLYFKKLYINIILPYRCARTTMSYTRVVPKVMSNNFL